MYYLIRSLENLKDYIQPSNPEEAVEILSEYENSKSIAGGTDLLLENDMNVEYLVDLKFTGLDYFKKNGSELIIGSMMTFNQLSSRLSDMNENNQLRGLELAIRSFGNPNILNVATIGGNICDPAPSADIPPVLLALDSKLVLLSSRGERIIPIEEFFLSYRKTDLKKDEILKEVIIPLPENRGVINSDFQKILRVKKDIAIINVATSSLTKDGEFKRIRIGMGAVAPTPIRALSAEIILKDKKPSSSLIERAAKQAISDARAISDFRASKEYREKMIETLVKRSLLELRDSK